MTGNAVGLVKDQDLVLHEGLAHRWLNPDGGMVQDAESVRVL